MAKAIALIGKICSGKTHYARRLQSELPAVILSCDEVMLGLFGNDLGERHDAVSRDVRAYLLRKAVEIVRAGANVVLDFGFWQCAYRAEISGFFTEAGVPLEWRWLDVSDDLWRRNIAARNELVRRGEDASYYVDEGLLAKCVRLFEPPSPDEPHIVISPEYDQD